MFDRSVVSVAGSDMRKSRKPHPIVQAVQSAASDLNDLLNAIGLRVSLLKHELQSSPSEAEIVRLAGLIEKASQRVQRLQEYSRAEQLVATMRPGRPKKRSGSSSPEAASPSFLAERRPRTALLITDPSADDGSIRENLEQGGFKVVVAESSADGLRLLQSNVGFDHIVCDSAFLAETGSKFTAELSRAAPASHVYVLSRPRVADRVDQRTH
jgi:PleD family two-component response regulator